jgi:hypothetical protein
MSHGVAQVESGLPKQPSFLDKLKLIQRLNEDLLDSDAQMERVEYITKIATW